jgi:general secretion pathway protein G
MAGAMTARRPDRTRSGSRGFTLLEIVIALAVMSVLLTMAVPVLQVQAQRQRESELRAALRDIRSAIDAYKRAADEGRIARAPDASGYPPSLDALVQGVPDLRDPAKRPIYFLRRLPGDPMLKSEDGAAVVEGWGLRSYASSPEEPRAGDDVFDVYSRSERVGSNGVPYRSW